MAIGDALVAPTGVQNQMYGQPSRVPGYSQGLGQAPGQMALPPEPMPIGRPTAVVGGPAYFTPQGYNAPPQPTEAFMPTDVRPDPIGQQFMRQMQSPMGQQFQAQYEATQAPIREAEMARRAEEQAAQDARFQEMMDRIAELEGQLAQPEPMPEPSPYIPGQTPFPGIPDFIRDLDFSNIDFSNIPGLSNFDYDDIMRQYNDRMEMGEPEPIESFLPDPKDFPPIGLNPPPGGFDGRDTISTMPVPVGPLTTRIRIENMLEDRLKNLPVPVEAPVMPRISMPELPDFSNIPTPESRSESPDFIPGSGMGRIGQGVATDRESLIGKTLFGQTITPESFSERETARSPFLRAVARPDLPAPEFSFGGKLTPAPVPNIPKIPNIPNIDLSNLPKFDLPTTGGRPMIPNFGNIKTFLR